MAKVLEMAEFLHDPFKYDREDDPTDRYETIAKPMIATLDDGRHLAIDAEWFGRSGSDIMDESNLWNFAVREVDDDTWKKIVSGDENAWITAVSDQDNDVPNADYDLVLDAIYRKDYKVIDIQEPKALETSRGVREMIELGDPYENVPLTSTYLVASLNDGTYAAAMARMWDHDPKALEYFELRVIDKKTFDSLLDGRKDVYELHDRLLEGAPELTNMDAYVDQRARTIQEALVKGDYTPTFTGTYDNPPTLEEINQARFQERLDEFGHMGADGTLQVDDKDAYIDFLRDTGDEKRLSEIEEPSTHDQPEPYDDPNLDPEVLRVLYNMAETHFANPPEPPEPQMPSQKEATEPTTDYDDEIIPF